MPSSNSPLRAILCGIALGVSAQSVVYRAASQATANFLPRSLRQRRLTNFFPRRRTPRSSSVAFCMALRRLERPAQGHLARYPSSTPTMNTCGSSSTRRVQGSSANRVYPVSCLSPASAWKGNLAQSNNSLPTERVCSTSFQYGMRCLATPLTVARRLGVSPDRSGRCGSGASISFHKALRAWRPASAFSSCSRLLQRQRSRDVLARTVIGRRVIAHSLEHRVARGGGWAQVRRVFLTAAQRMPPSDTVHADCRNLFQRARLFDTTINGALAHRRLLPAWSRFTTSALRRD